MTFRKLTKTVSLLVILTLVSCASGEKKQTPTEKKAELFFSHGTQQLIEKNYTDALSYLLKAHKLTPNNPKILNNLGMAYYLKKRPQKAKLFFERSLEINPKDSDTRNNLASIYYSEKKYNLALKEYKKILKDLLYKQQYRTYHNIGLIYQLQGMNLAAIEHFKLAINENNNYCASHFQLGEIASKRYDYKTALKHFKDASKGSCINNPAPIYKQAITLIKLRKYVDAEVKLSYVKEKFPKSNYASLATIKLKKLKSMKFDKSLSTMTRKEILLHINKKKNNTQTYNSPTF